MQFHATSLPLFHSANGAPESRIASVDAFLRADPVLRPVLRHARTVVDRGYVLAPAGLLADAGRPDTADALLRDHL